VKVTFLGTGTSYGVPVIGCDCPVCTSSNPKNHRTRAAALVSENGYNVLIDASVELRLQCLANDVRQIDAVLLTHEHADHIFGLDDLRRFTIGKGRAMPIYGAAHTLRSVKRSFWYVFEKTQEGGGKPKFSLIELDRTQNICDMCVEAIDVFHGELPVTAFRIGPFAYATDVSRIPSESFERLRGLDTLVLDALRPKPHVTHFSLQQAIDVARQLRPRRTFFTHMTHDLEYEATNASLPEGMALAYDGLVIEI